MKIFMSPTELFGIPSILPNTGASFISPQDLAPLAWPSGLLSLFSRRQLKPGRGSNIVRGHTAMKQSSWNPKSVFNTVLCHSFYIQIHLRDCSSMAPDSRIWGFCPCHFHYDLNMQICTITVFSRLWLRGRSPWGSPSSHTLGKSL